MSFIKCLAIKILGGSSAMGKSATKAYADQLLRVSFSLFAIAMMSLLAIVSYYIFSPFSKFIISTIVDINVAWVIFGVSIILSLLAHRSAISLYNAYDKGAKDSDSV